MKKIVKNWSQFNESKNELSSDEIYEKSKDFIKNHDNLEEIIEYLKKFKTNKRWEKIKVYVVEYLMDKFDGDKVKDNYTLSDKSLSDILIDNELDRKIQISTSHNNDISINNKKTDTIYSANELVFYIHENPDEFGEPVVLIAPKDDLSFDNLNYHTINPEDFKKAGIDPYEYSEGVFAFIDDTLTTQQYRKNILAAGFQQDSEWDTICKKHTSD
jgi:hypothetical protein